MPKRKWVVRICTDNFALDRATGLPNLNYIEPAFLQCLSNAGLGTLHDTDREGYTFDMYPPRDVDDKMWAEQNAERTKSFGFNAAAAPRVQNGGYEYMEIERVVHCTDCGVKITISASRKEDLPHDDEKILCQKCDPGFASLLDNKYHKV